MSDIAREILETVAGIRCPCGHEAALHEPPSGDIDGETMGPCSYCGCQGVIDLRSDDVDEDFDVEEVFLENDEL